MKTIHMAVDIGGSNTKITTVRYADEQIENILEETIPNPPLYLFGHQFINIYGLYETILNSLRYARQSELLITSLGIDTYGNGYGVIDNNGNLIGLPFFYKDARTKGILEALSGRVPLRNLYQRTGVFPTDIRVLVQLFFEVLSKNYVKNEPNTLLLFPDILAYFFTGDITTERSMASVAQLLNLQGVWCTDVFRELDIDPNIFPPLIVGGESGFTPIKSDLRKLVDQPAASFVNVVTHDTESALLAAPLLDANAVFASLGTSIIFGARTKNAVISDLAFNAQFKNVLGAFGQNSFCRDYTGLWLLEQCFNQWRMTNPSLTYSDIIEACRNSPPNDSYFDVNSPNIRFFETSLENAIRSYCRKTKQKQPEGIGPISLCILESIVLEAKWSYEKVKQLTNRDSYQRLSTVGGGVHNILLLQMLADALELCVYVGTSYAATSGNILMQLHALGMLSKNDVLSFYRDSNHKKRIEPRSQHFQKWETALTRLTYFKSLL